MYIFEPESLDRAAFESNEADRDALPQTFVDYAETVWRKLENATQQEVADEMGWSRSYVARYSGLRSLEGEAWNVVTTFSRKEACQAFEGGTEIVTSVTFTEGLLRNIVTLTASQQLELVTELADGTITKGKFKSRAKALRCGHSVVCCRSEVLRELFGFLGRLHLSSQFLIEANASLHGPRVDFVALSVLRNQVVDCISNLDEKVTNRDRLNGSRIAIRKPRLSYQLEQHAAYFVVLIGPTENVCAQEVDRDEVLVRRAQVIVQQ